MKNGEDKNNSKNESALVTKESLCATVAVFAFLAAIILCSRSLVFGELGLSVHSFLTGVFGYLAYPVVFGALYLSVTGLVGVKLVKNRRFAWCLGFAILCASLIVHTALTYSWERDGYLSKCFTTGELFPNATVGGWLGGLLVYLVSAVMSNLGAIVLFSVLTAFSVYLCAVSYKKSAAKMTQEPQISQEPVQEAVPQATEEQGYALEERTEQPAPKSVQSVFSMPSVEQRPGVRLSEESAVSEEIAFSPENSRTFLFGSTPAENFKRNLIFDPNAQVNKRQTQTPAPEPVIPSYTEAYQSAVNEEKEEQRQVNVVNEYVNPYALEEEPLQPIEEEVLEYPAPTPAIEEPVQVKEEPKEDYRRHDYMELFSPSNPNLFGGVDNVKREEPSRDSFGRGTELFETDRTRGEERGRDGLRLFDEEEEEEENDPYTLRSTFDIQDRDSGFEVRGRDFESLGRSERALSEPAKEESKPIEPPKPVEPPKPRVIRPYKRMPLDDFDCRDVEPTADDEEVEETKQTIIATLEDFKVTGASIASVTFGPTVTRYNVTLPRSISPRKVVALDQSIAISLHSNGVNIYPNYEDGVVSIEVPNKERQFVNLGCMLTGDSFVNAKSSSLMFTMGKNVANAKIYGDISKMIHLLVAGSSGSGKSVFLGALIVSMIHKYSPEELRLILIDPKKTEFVLYNNLPHLMINEIITDVNKTVQSLNWAIGEMNRRYGLFEQMSRAGTYVVNLDQYNAQLEKAKRLPKIVNIIDELADLMLAAKKEIEDRIQNLTQKARAAGIHLIVATQRPSTDVITGVIKSNLPTRIAFYVATDVDSRVILDQTGAQKLLGKGDFLYTMPGINTPVRVQSAFISPEDSQKVVNFIKANNEAYYDEEATAYINNSRMPGDDSLSDKTEVDPMYIEALRYVILSGSASISMIQRKCSAGYNRAGKIIEWMEDMGYISAFDGAKARKVLITKEEFESKYGPLQ